jgi:probable HAF family extracellular repeat protein
LTWLGALGTFSDARGVSNDGKVVVGVGDVSDTLSETRAFRWTAAGGMQDLGISHGQCTDISADGSVIVGFYYSPSGFEHGFRWTASGGMVDLGPGSTDATCYATGVSGDGLVTVGWVERNNPTGGGTYQRGAIWDRSGGMSELGTLGRESSSANATNGNGSVVVGGSITANNETHAFLSSGGLMDLGTLPGYRNSGAGGVSASGSFVVGTVFGGISVYLPDHPFIWSGAMQDLGVPPGGYWAQAHAVSDDGSVVVGGGGNNIGTQALRWTSSGPEDLNESYSYLLKDRSRLENARDLSDDGRYIVGTGYNMATGRYEAYLLDTEGTLRITHPVAGSKFISGTMDTIRWTGGNPGHAVTIFLSGNDGMTYDIFIGTAPGGAGEFAWQIPRNLLFAKARVRVQDIAEPAISARTGRFQIKPLLLTRLQPDGNYYVYSKDRDQWGFSNEQRDIFPDEWYKKFDYRGTDTLTGRQYDQRVGGRAFSLANDYDYPDWPAFVRAFGVNACYRNAALGIYNETAVLRWAILNSPYDGACFGIAASNALQFRYPESFHAAFPEFPPVSRPASTTSNDGVKMVVSELFSHQADAVSRENDVFGKGKTPLETLREVADMLAEDDVPIRTLTLGSNDTTRPGWHTVVPYALEQDTTQSNLFHIYMFDSNYPNSPHPITVDLAGNNGDGTWSTPNRVGWGGAGKLYLEVTSDNYLRSGIVTAPAGSPHLPASSSSTSAEARSPFLLPGGILEVYYKSGAPVSISDPSVSGQTTGFTGGAVREEIPGSASIGSKTGSEGPPRGYSLPKKSYSITLNAFASDTARVYLLADNRSFLYERTDANPAQTDRLAFDTGEYQSEGAVAVVNPDDATKTVSLQVIVDAPTGDKVCAVRSLNVARDDSVRFETIFEALQLSSHGTTPNFYEIELRYATADGVKVFGASNVGLPPNSTHRFFPLWTDLEASALEVWEDAGSDGTWDGVLYLTNELTGVEERGSPALPGTHRLGQNYPNPFNPSTTIEFSIPKSQLVSLKVFNALGQEVAVLVDGTLAAGDHSVSFDARQLPSGVYFYRISAGGFVESKKMVLMK